MQRYRKTEVVTRETDRLTAVCKQHNIPFEHHGIYREWLLQTQRNSSGGKLTPDQPPTGRGQRLPPHLRLPKPHGPVRKQIKKERFKTTQKHAHTKNNTRHTHHTLNTNSTHNTNTNKLTQHNIQKITTHKEGMSINAIDSQLD